MIAGLPVHDPTLHVHLNQVVAMARHDLKALESDLVAELGGT